jgi:uncharacterized protein with HEPN domain
LRNDDLIRLRHMLDAARDAVLFARGRAREDMDGDRQFVFALVKCVEIIGEAASQVSDETRRELTQLPWREMIDMRHRMVHAYYDINLEILWRTVRNDLPPLIQILEQVPGLPTDAET